MPERIQRQRTKGWRMPEGAVYVGRPSEWGNPFAAIASPSWPRWGGPRPYVVVEQGTEKVWYPDDDRRVIVGRDAAEAASYRRAVEYAVELFELHIGPMGNHEYDAEKLARLRSALGGKDLACWCPKGQPCHADALLRIAHEDVTG